MTVALKDCLDHGLNGEAAVAENFLSTGNPIGTHSTDGWPTFAGWPRHESLTHESTYWKWIERAWRGGLRIMVNDLVENRALCEIYPLKQNDCNEMVSVRRQAQDMFALQDYIDAQFGGPGKGFFRIVRVAGRGPPGHPRGQARGDPRRRGVGGPRLRHDDDAPQCTRRRSTSGSTELYALGVRSLFPVHKFDNALGGTALRRRRHRPARQRRQQVRHRRVVGGRAVRAGRRSRQHAHQPLRQQRAAVPAARRQRSATSCSAATCPPIRRRRSATRRASRRSARTSINGMIELGMIIETDHMSVKARDEALDIIEARDYSGVITQPQLGRRHRQQRLQALGGVVAPYGPRRHALRRVVAARPGPAARPTSCSASGYGSDNNGLGAQPRTPCRGGGQPGDVPVHDLRRRHRDGPAAVRAPASTTSTSTACAHYGLFPDYIEDLRMIAGDQIVDDMANGAEAYLQMWARAHAARTG